MKYRGLIYYGEEDFRMEDLEMPECGDNDVILKNVVASICGADVDTWKNGGEMHYMPEKCEFGHEVSCEVWKVGKNVKGIKVGDRVAPYPIMTTPNPRKAGYLGGFSEYIYCTNASYETNLFHLPDSMTYEEAALIEPLSVSLRGADIVPVSDKTVALVLGAGFIGFGLATGLVWKGVKPENITIVDRCQNRLDICKKAGFKTVWSKEPDWKEKVIASTGEARCVYGRGSNADVIYDCAGSIDKENPEPTLAEDALKLLKYFGKFVAVGVHRREVHINMQKLVFGMTDILCGSGAVKKYFEEAIEIIASGKFDYEGTITRKYKGEEAKEAIISACDANSCMKVVVDYRL